MKYSVIVTTYKREKLLHRCLKSFKNLENAEIILVNDETDRKYVNSDFEYLNNLTIINANKNMGLSISRNTGILNAKGEYVYMIDDDDWVTDEFITFLNENNLHKNIYRLPYVAVKNGEKLWRVRFPFSWRKLRFIDRLNTVEVSTFLIKRKFLSDKKILFPNNRYYYEDLIFFAQLLETKEPMYMKKFIAFNYEKTPYDVGISKSFDYDKHINDFFKLLDSVELKNKRGISVIRMIDMIDVGRNKMTREEMQKIFDIEKKLWSVKLLKYVPPIYLIRHFKIKFILHKKKNKH